ncbi:hypothetical protein Hanom_Chr12g01068001 [Helianthus anomalus]
MKVVCLWWVSSNGGGDGDGGCGGRVFCSPLLPQPLVVVVFEREEVVVALLYNELYIFMEPIKSNHFLNQYSPSDHAEMKSQPFKLQKITALMAVPGGYGRFLQLVVTSTFCCPLSPLHDLTA